MKSRNDLKDIPLGELRQVTIVCQTRDYGMRTRCVDVQVGDLDRLNEIIDEISVS